MAGVKIYMANTIDELVEKIELKRKSPFHQLTFVTQTAGIKHYLSLKLADREKVFCHGAFLTPNELMMDVARLLGNPNSSEFSTENMRWRIFSLLDEEEFKQEFPFVMEYYHGDELKRIQLATKLADLFDQYIVYRTDMMTAWQENRFTLFNNSATKDHETEAWQKWLWARLKEDIGGGYKDKAEYQRYLLEQLTSNDLDTNEILQLKDKYSHIHIFGLTVLTKFHMELLWHLKNVCHVHFYFVNPCVSDFWYDSMPQKDIVRKWWWHKDKEVLQEYSTGNELLSSWGKVVKELFTQLFSLDDEVFSYIEYEEGHQETNTLLQSLQHDIKNNTRLEEAAPLPLELIEDKSLQVTSHYSKVRELEVLFDYLADLIDNHYKGRIEPHEVVVMLPKVEEYVSYIRAVFDNAPRKIPYSIGDRSTNSEQSAMTVALELLQVVSEDFTSESVLQLLDFNLIRKKYGIQDINAIRRAVKELNVRYGTSGEKDLETHLVGWEQGLTRLIMGVFMRDSIVEYGGETYEPYKEAEGAGVEQLVSFVSFVRNLIFQAKITRGDKKLSQWNEYFVNLLDRLVLADEEEQQGDENEEIASLKKKLDAFNEIDEKLNGVSLSFESYLYILKTAYENEKVGDGYYRGRVTFCQALPMRSIPFKVVAFLGLNKNDFPRVDADYAFDLIKVSNDLSGKSKLGDRVTKDNDKYLFLEALLNAKDYLYLSYVGKSIKDNKEKSRSGVLEELLDYVQTRTNVPDAKKLLVTQHPLQPFSKDYVKKGTTLFTYLTPSKKTSFKKSVQEKKEKENLLSLDLTELLRFYKHPIRYYMNRELGVYDNTEELLLSQEETFLIENNLEKYLFKQEFVKSSVPDKERINELKREGRVPLKNMAQVEINKLSESFLPVIEAVNEFRKDKKKETISSVVGLEKIVLSGEIDDVWDGTLLGVHVSSAAKVNNTKFVEYLKWLFLRASGREVSARVIHLKYGGNLEVEKIESHALSVNEAKERLDLFVSFYLENRSRLVPFLPVVSSNFAKIKTGEWRKKVEQVSEHDFYLTASLKEKIWEDERVEEVAAYLMADFNEIWKK